MRHASLTAFLARPPAAFAKGPVAVIMAEDEVELASTVAHHVALGFGAVLLLVPPVMALDGITQGAGLHVIDHDVHAEGALVEAVNAVSGAVVSGTWIYYCYNGEYLFFPFCESRSIGEFLTFHAEERRDAMIGFVVDLYSADLDRHPNAVSREQAHLDRTGYFALARKDPAKDWAPKERQLDFFGGLRWRFEEHIPAPRRKIDRVALFKARRGNRLLPDFTFTDEEYNTYSCPWHHNMTAAVCSFRTAKALRTNPGSRYDIPTFHWRNSVPFTWSSQQLMDLGLMEPGQWF